MPRIPMPSPNGTNYERLFVSADPVMAFDSATFCGFPIGDALPITSERIRARALPRQQENRKVPRYAMDEADTENETDQDDKAIKLPPGILDFLRIKLGPNDYDQLADMLANPEKWTPDDSIAMDRAARARMLAARPSADFLARFPHALRLK